MRKQQYIPYFFNYKYERRTYKYIGRDYGDHIIVDKGWIRNLSRWYRKRIYNRKESKYKFCNTYEEWRRYLLEKQFYNACVKQNMIKYLNRQKRVLEIIFESIKTIIIPIYIAIYSGAIALMDNVFQEKESSASEHMMFMAVCMMMLTLLIICVSSYWIHKNRDDFCFYEDYIDYQKNE